MNAPGYNPLRWDCVKSGCYNKILRPRIEEFADCFPGRIAMSDVDGVVEIAGHFLFLEWKASGGSVSTGQRIMFEHLTKLSHKITVLVVKGHPREMTIEAVQIFHNGRAGAFEICDFDALKTRIRAWTDRASKSRNG